VIEHQEMDFETGHEDKDRYDDKTEYASTPMFQLVTLWKTLSS
jgi:hypothetical protein